MPAYRSFQLNCTCGHEFKAILWDSINVTEQRELKSKLMNGEINQIHCKQCKKKSYVEKHLLYHDMDQQLWVQMFPGSDRTKWQELEAEHKEILKKKIHIRKYHFRLVFGREELLEKIRIFDHKLDDRVIELIKLKIIEQDDNVKNIPDANLQFSQYLPEVGEIHFKMISLEKSISQTLAIPYEHYDELLEAQEHVKSPDKSAHRICDGMYINVNKMRTFH